MLTRLFFITMAVLCTASLAHAEDPMRVACGNATYATDHYTICKDLANMPYFPQGVAPSVFMQMAPGDQLIGFPGSYDACLDMWKLRDPNVPPETHCFKVAR